MQAARISTTVMAAVAAAMALATVPSQAQAPVAAPVVVPPKGHHRAPAQVTVTPRPGGDIDYEAKRRSEFYGLYSLEYGPDPMRNSTLFQNGPSLPFIHNRMPFPTCLDLPGFCR